MLAGEANSPGSYSKRTVNFLSHLDKNDATLFTTLCGFGCSIGDIIVPLVFDQDDAIYKNHGIKFGPLLYLQGIGSVEFRTQGFTLNIPKHQEMSYHGIAFVLEMPEELNNKLDIGRVVLTKVGVELAPICGSQPIDGFLDYVKTYWKAFIKDGSEEDIA